MDAENLNPIRKMVFEKGITLSIIQGDITRIEAGAIVNAANKHLRHGGGVAGAISKLGGPAIQAQSDDWITRYGPITFSQPAFTQGGNLPAKFVIHTVGPVWGEGDEDRKLYVAIQSALRMAETLKVSSITLPAISTGIFGFPVQRAAKIFMAALNDFSKENADHLKRITLVLFDNETVTQFCEAFDSFAWEETKS